MPHFVCNIDTDFFFFFFLFFFWQKHLDTQHKWKWIKVVYRCLNAILWVCACMCVSRPLQDKDFGNQNLFQAHNNPAAELSSSLKHYQQHSLDRAYKGQDFFWALTPTQDDYILFNFPQPIHISGSVRNGFSKVDSTRHFFNPQCFNQGQ